MAAGAGNVAARAGGGFALGRAAVDWCWGKANHQLQRTVGTSN
jgi:hypothetical protein